MKIYCSFSGVYSERNLKEDELRVSLEDIDGTMGYCSDEAAKLIERRLEKFGPDGIHFLDNGNYHYASLFWMRKIDEPFSLVVFDRHTDMQPSVLVPVLSCGNWIAKAQKDPSVPLKKTLLIGAPKADIEVARCEKETLFVEESEAAAFFDTRNVKACGALSKIAGDPYPIYISIDKDVLSKDEIEVNWEQGRMSLDALSNALMFLCESCDLIGVDVCGEAEPYARLSPEHVKNERRLYDIISSLRI